MKIVAIETIVPGELSPLPSLVFVRVHTDAGLVGCGETYYTPRAVSTYIHEFLAPLRHGDGRHRSRSALGHGVPRGGEVRRQGPRAPGAVGGRHRRVGPRRRRPPGCRSTSVLGGPVRASVATYNTCAGPTYGRGWRPGHGDATEIGRLDDFAGFLDRPAELARELIDEGFAGMKIWPFDQIAQGARRPGHHPGRPRAAVSSRSDSSAKRWAHASRSWPRVTGSGRSARPRSSRRGSSRTSRPGSRISSSPTAPTRSPSSSGRPPIPVLASEYLMTRFEYAPMIRSRRGRPRDDRPHVVRWDHRGPSDHRARRRGTAPGHDARLHRAVHAPRRYPSRVQLDERELPGGRARATCDSCTRSSSTIRSSWSTAGSCRPHGRASVPSSGPTSSIAPASSSDGAGSREPANDGEDHG